MTNTKNKKTKKSLSDLDHFFLTQFRNKLSDPSKLTLEELKEVSEIRGFSDLPISDIRLVTELLGGLNVISARREGKPSRTQCLSYIKTKIQDYGESQPLREECDSIPSREERHDDINYPSSDDFESDDDVNEYDRRRRAFEKCLKVVID
jgi:hypothetical protein